jgi:hypothetical protein
MRNRLLLLGLLIVFSVPQVSAFSLFNNLCFPLANGTPCINWTGSYYTFTGIEFDTTSLFYTNVTNLQTSNATVFDQLTAIKTVDDNQNASITATATLTQTKAATGYSGYCQYGIAGITSTNASAPNATCADAPTTSGTGNVTSSNGTAGYVARFTNSTNLISSSIIENGSIVTINDDLNLTVNNYIELTTNTPTGGISKSLRFNMQTAYDRPWIAWYDENARLRTASGYHTLDLSNDTHEAYEIKTSSDPGGALPNDMVTRLSIGTDDELVVASFNGASQFIVRNDTSTLLEFNTSSSILEIGSGSNVPAYTDYSGRVRVGYNGANALIKGETSRGFLVQTNGSNDRLFVTASGLVGINTTTPGSVLDVRGNTNVSGIFYTPQICLNGDCQTSWPSSAPANATMPNPETFFTLREDFMHATGTTAYTYLGGAAVSSGTTSTLAADSTDSIGVSTISDSTTIGGGYFFRTQVSAFRLGGGEEGLFRVRMNPAAKAGQTVGYLGFIDTATNAQSVDGCYFRYIADNNGTRVFGECANNSVRTNTTSQYVATNNTWYVYNVSITGNGTPLGTYANFTITNGTGAILFAGNVSGNIPLASGRETGFGIIATQSTTDAASVIAHIDYAYLNVRRFLQRY